MYQIIPLHSCDYLCKISIKINVVIDEGNSRNEIWRLKKRWLHKVGSECDIYSWPGSSFRQSVITEFSGREFKSHPNQLSIAASKSPLQ